MKIQDTSAMLYSFLAWLKKTRKTRYRKLLLDDCCVVVYGFIDIYHGLACRTPREVLLDFCAVLSNVGTLKRKPNSGEANGWIDEFARSDDATKLCAIKIAAQSTTERIDSYDA